MRDVRPGWVFGMSLALLVLFIGFALVMPAQFAGAAAAALHFTTSHFGWLYLFVTTGFLLFSVGIALSDSGHIRLGADGEAPEFSYRSWLGMIFSAGMGVGLVFWGVAEPMTHYAAPPLRAAEPSSPASAGLAMRYSLFHWGFHQWANFCVVGLAIAYVRFRQQRPGLISETFRSTLGGRVDGGLRTVLGAVRWQFHRTDFPGSHRARVHCRGDRHAGAFERALVCHFRRLGPVL